VRASDLLQACSRRKNELCPLVWIVKLYSRYRNRKINRKGRR
jgi:hypothetical protein